MYDQNFSRVMIHIGYKKLVEAGFYTQLNSISHLPKWLLIQHDVLDHYYNPTGEILPTNLSGEWLADFNRQGRWFADYGVKPIEGDWRRNIKKFREAVEMTEPYEIPPYSWLIECYEYWRFKLRDFQ